MCMFRYMLETLLTEKTLNPRHKHGSNFKIGTFPDNFGNSVKPVEDKSKLHKLEKL